LPRAPDTELLELRQLRPRHRDALAHVGSRVGVHRQRHVKIGTVQRAQEAREREPDLDPRLVVELGLARLDAGQQLAAEERPRVALRRAPDEDRLRHRQRQKRREARQHRELPLDARDRDLPSREPEGVPLVHDPDGVVPAFGEPAQRAHLELWKLSQESARQLVVDGDLCAPDWHRP
jgi:hypothetical protein